MFQNRSRIKYYLSQGFFSLRHSIVIGIAFALALSVISGLGFYSEAYGRYVIQEELTQFLDLDMRISSNKLMADYAFRGLDENITDFYAENSELIQSLHHYSLVQSDISYWFVNNSRIPADIRGFYSDDLIFNIRYFTMDTGFYTSARFPNFFDIINGSYPKANNEILLDFTFAQLLNASIGEKISIPIRNYQSTIYHLRYEDSMDDNYINKTGPYYENEDFFYFNTNFTLVGTYASTHQSYNIGKLLFSTSYSYDVLKKEVSAPDLTSPKFSPVFGFYDFTNKTCFTDFQQTLIDINFWYDNYDTTYLHYSYYGMYALYNRDTISFGKFSSTADDIIIETENLQRPYAGNIAVINYLTRSLENLYYQTEIIRTISLLLTIPLMITAIILSVFARKTEIKARLDEYLLLRSKGSPVRMLIYQFFSESIFIGIFSIILGILLGFCNFYLFQKFCNIIFGINENSKLTFYFSIQPLINTTLFGLVAAILGSLSGILYIIKLPIAEILKIKESGDNPPEIDEKSLYQKKLKNQKSIMPKNQISKEELMTQTNISDGGQFNSSTRNITDQIELRQRLSQLQPNQQNSVSVVSALKKLENENSKENRIKSEKDPLKDHDSKIKTKSISLIILSLIPLIFYLFGIISIKYNNAPDFLDIFGNIIRNNENIFTIFLLFSPPLAVGGIVQIICTEKTRFFANWTKILSNVIIKNFGYLIGIEMVKKRQIKVLIMILAIFTSIFGFVNVFMNSYVKNEIIIQNLEIGADLKVELHITNPKIENFADIYEWEEKIENLSINDNQKIIQSINTVLIEDESQYNPSFRNIFYINIEKYFNSIIEDDKPILVPKLESYFQDLIEYNKENPQVPGVIVNSLYATEYNLEINDNIEIFHQFRNNSNLDNEITVIQGKIIHILDSIPGLYSEKELSLQYTENLVFDQSLLNQTADYRHSLHLCQYFDLNQTLDYDISQIPFYLTRLTGDNIKYQSMQFYDQSWRELDTAFTSNAFGFYTMIYIDFIVIGILISFGAAVIMLSIQKENKFYNGLLLSRGFGKKNILLMIGAEIAVIFFTATIIGIVVGVGFAILYINLNGMVNKASQGLSLNIYSNANDFLFIFGLLFGSTVLIMGVQFLLDTRDNISKFLHKF